MKIKSVLLAGLVSAAGAISLSAAEVYSVNVVGFANVTVPAENFAIISNPLNNSAGNTLPNLLPNAPEGVIVYRFDLAVQSFSTYSKGSRGWSGTGVDGQTAAQALFNTGEGFFIYNPSASAVALTFVGEVPQGAALNITIPGGFSMLASKVPQSDKLETVLGLPYQSGDVVYFFRNGAYQLASKGTRGWSGPGVDASGEPKPGVGEGFFYFNSTTSRTWTRNFDANATVPN